MNESLIWSSLGSSSDWCKSALTDAVTLWSAALEALRVCQPWQQHSVWSESYTPSLPLGSTSNTVDTLKWMWSGDRVESGLWFNVLSEVWDPVWLSNKDSLAAQLWLQQSGMKWLNPLNHWQYFFNIHILDVQAYGRVSVGQCSI